MRNALLDDLQAIRQIAAEGRLEEAQKQLEGLTSDRIALPGDHLQCAELAMELAMLKVAERELQLELRDLRVHPEPSRQQRALAASAEVSEALGNRARSHTYRSLLAKVRGEAPPPTPRFDPIGSTPATRPTARSDIARPTPARPQRAPHAATTDEAARPARASPRPSPQGLAPPRTSDIARFLHLYSGRENVHARQWLDPSGRGGYSPVQKALTHELLSAHFAGTMTLGVYQTRIDGSVTFFALDLDATKLALNRASQSPKAAADLAESIAMQGRRMHAEARRLGLDLVLEDSGYKGRHLWGFLETPMAAGVIRNFIKALGRALAPNDERLALECFPKQEKLGADQIGNLIKLPLGIHLKTGRRAQLLEPNGEVAADPWQLLAEARRHTHEELMEVWSRLKVGPMDPGHGERPQDGIRPAAPLPAPPDFSEIDFSTHPELRDALGGCAVLRKLVKQGLETRRLSHAEQIVVRHTLGHRPIGIAAVNYLFRRCPEVGPDMYLKSVLSGHPISCPKIRKRIPEVTSRLPCNCHFGDQLDHYPTPNLHIRKLEADASNEPASVARTSTATSAPQSPGSSVEKAAVADALRPSMREAAERRADTSSGLDASPPVAHREGKEQVSAPAPRRPSSPVDAREEAIPRSAPAAPSDLGKLPLIAQRYWHLTERVHRLGLELAASEHEFLEALRLIPGERYEDSEGTTEVVRVGGIPKIRFTPKGSSTS